MLLRRDNHWLTCYTISNKEDTMKLVYLILLGGLAVAAYLLATSYRDILRYRAIREM